MPVTPNLFKEWADLALRSAGQEGPSVGKNWPYRSIQRLPTEINLRPVKQKTKEDKRT